MKCESARRLLEFARPGARELESADLAALERHLAECAACDKLHRAQQRDDERLSTAMQAVPVPAGGRASALARLKSARTVWWRTRLLGATAVVLALTLLTTIVNRYWGRPVFDPSLIAQATYEQAGQFRSADEARQVADAWLRSIDRRLSAPAEWNYRSVAFFGRADFEGLPSVPMLVLTRADAVARIYVVRASAFRNLDDGNQTSEEGGSVVAVRRYPELPGWAFIAVVTGGPLEFFLRTTPSRDPA